MSTARGSATTGITLVVAAVLAGVLGLGAAWWLAQPDRSIGQYERLGAEIGCVCGTCPNRPIATCGCGFADTMLGELRELVDQGNDDRQVMAAFGARYGELVRIKPESRGLDLTAWAAPLIMLSVGAVLLGAVVLRWVGRGRQAGEQASAEAPSPAPDAPTGSVDPDDADRLRARVDRELEDLDP